MRDRSSEARTSGDATVFPYWLGVVPRDEGLREALAAAEGEGLVSPLAMRYVARRERAAEDRWQRLFVPDYQGTAIWTSLGAIYLHLLARVDPAAAAAGIAGYARLVERDGTVWEVLGDDLRPYVGRLGIFRADEAMLWSAILLDLFENGPATSGTEPPPS
jgi:hypothetical protein